MRNLTRFALVLTLAACGPQAKNAVNCELDPTAPGCTSPECAQDSDCDDGDECTVDDCNASGACIDFNTCEAEVAANTVLFVNDNDSMFFAAEFDNSGGLDEFVDAEDAQLAAIAIGTCAETPSLNVGGEPAPESMGNVQLERDGVTLFDIAASANSTYEQIVAAGTIGLGDQLDLRITGSAAVSPVFFADAFDVIGARPALTLNADGAVVLEGLTYEPTNTDQLLFRFNFIEGQTGVTLTCAADPAGVGFVFDPAVLDRLPDSGQLTVIVRNRSFGSMTTPEGDRAIRNSVEAGDGLPYQKTAAP